MNSTNHEEYMGMFLTIEDGVFVCHVATEEGGEGTSCEGELSFIVHIFVY